MLYSFFRFSLGVLVVLICVGVPVVSWAQDTRLPIQDAFGMNMHMHQRIPFSSREESARIAADAGVSWAREEFNWNDIEPVDDQFVWDDYDSIVSLYEQHDIEVLGLLTYSADWASTQSLSPESEFFMPDMTAWRDYVAQVAQRYAGRIDYWEIWNEPNHEGFWKGDAATYTELLRAASEEIRAVQPDAHIVLGGLSGADSDFLRQVYTALNDASVIDVVAIHPYRVVSGDFNYSPETTADALNTLTTDTYNVLSVMRRYDDAETPVWFTEVGWTTASAGVSEEVQAQLLLRLYTIALHIPSVEKVFWYTFQDAGSNQENIENGFGVVDTDFAPKQALDAFTFVQERLTGATTARPLLPQARVIDTFSASSVPTARWSFNGTVCTNGTLAQARKRSRLIIDYAFTAADNCYAPITSGMELPDHTRAVQLRIRGSNDSAILRVRIQDASGEIFQYNLGHAPDEWLEYTTQLSQAATSWGGNMNGRLDHPLRFNSLIVNNSNNEQSSGTIRLDAIRTSTRAHTYIYPFVLNSTQVYAVWNTQKSRTQRIHIPEAARVRIQTYGQASRVAVSEQGIYRIVAQPILTLLQEME